MTYRKIILLFVILSACSKTKDTRLFELISNEKSNINFNNTLDYTENLNPYTYRNFYNGGGVAIGDFNNDSLQDIFFAGNLVSNKLYLNKGNLSFQDITEQSGLESEGIWSTGVSVVDINSDGYLDIYVCKSGPPGGKRRYNELFINNGDLTFTEKAKEYGLDNEGLSTHAAFFDYDKDGDLDCYLLNNTIRSIGIGIDLVKDLRLKGSDKGNKFLRNDDGKFVDVSDEVGIYTSEIGFGLGVTIGDLNLDGWQDMYISNDFFEKDYLYINNQDGTFKESLEEYLSEISMGSMGADMADINNDSYPEIFVSEMLPERHDRRVSKAVFESWDKYQLSLSQGYYNQFNRNVLQLNNADGSFSEISRITGIDATDWSWGALIFDMDNDGLKDIFVANGIYKDLLDQDYVNFLANPSIISNMIKSEKEPIRKLIDMIPTEPIGNYAFKNNGNLSFSNVSSQFGLDEPSFSNGSAYSDLDNDGDLDLVINNVNMKASIYKNNSEKNWVSFSFNSSGKNSYGIGNKVYVYTNGEVQYQELSPMRGFQSSVDYRLYFGLDTIKNIDSVRVVWNNGLKSFSKNLSVNEHYVFYDSLASNEIEDVSNDSKLNILKNKDVIIDYLHTENEFVDFDRERLLFKMNSNEGPCVCVDDFNGDGLDDFFVGSAKGSISSLFFQSEQTFVKYSKPFEIDIDSEDIDCLSGDFNGDGFVDLIVASGGSEYSNFSPELRDRLYLNNGKNIFSKEESAFIDINKFESTSTISASDIDGDSDLDLFLGTRLNTGSYGIKTQNYILINNGLGIFEDQSDEYFGDNRLMGMVTDSEFVDIDLDGTKELIVVGEWMPVGVYKIDNGKFINISSKLGLEKSNGLYNTLEVVINKDSFPDIIIGNHGLNSFFRASESHPLTMYVNDFDRNGRTEQIMGMYYGDDLYPVVQLKDLWMQIPSLKKQFLKFENYKNKKMDELFSKEIIEDTDKVYVYNLASVYLKNIKGKEFSLVELPFDAQLSTVNSILVDDFNGDNLYDFIIGGNSTKIKPEYGINTGNFSKMFLGTNEGFYALGSYESGLKIKGEIRDIQKLKRKERINYIFAINNSSLKFYEREN